MRWAALIGLLALGCGADVAHGQGICCPAPATVYTVASPVVVTAYSPVACCPTRAVCPTTTYYAPTVVYQPVTSVAPVATYVPVTTTHFVGRNVVGQPKLYTPGQPVRNVLRYLSP